MSQARSTAPVFRRMDARTLLPPSLFCIDSTRPCRDFCSPDRQSEDAFALSSFCFFVFFFFFFFFFWGGFFFGGGVFFWGVFVLFFFFFLFFLGFFFGGFFSRRSSRVFLSLFSSPTSRSSPWTSPLPLPGRSRARVAAVRDGALDSFFYITCCATPFPSSEFALGPPPPSLPSSLPALA